MLYDFMADKDSRNELNVHLIASSNMKCPKKDVENDFVMWCHFYFILKCSKIEDYQFRFLFCFKIYHVFFLNAPDFLFLEIFEMPLFS